ncbi:MAG: PAS domain S-box protein [Solidesulfovibrio sp. DCME]|uniref:PAS domain S-box protein n=1 Tax=Solidesulfovibrio sp. DCME TaxID=3447380 RepID=UPI003D136410
MIHGLGQRAKLLVLALLVASVLVVPVSWLLWRLEARRFDENRRAEVSAHLGDIRLSLRAALDARLAFLHALAAFAASDPEVTRQAFAAFAASLIEGVPGIRSLQLARDGVVSHVFPETGNDGILGLNLVRDLPPGQRQPLREALEHGRVVVTGPVDLLQGGQGLIAREPVYPAGPQPKPARLWGLATVIIDTGTFFASLHLDQDMGLRLAIREQAADASPGAMLFGDPAIFAADPETAAMPVPGGAWLLAAVPPGGWSWPPPQASLVAAAGCTWLALGAAFFVFLSWPARLSRAVARATAALDAANTDLERTVASRTVALTQANAALRLGEARYRAFIDATGDMAFLKDAGLRHLVANRPLAAFFGKTPEEVLGRTDYELMPPALAGRCHESDLAAREGGEMVTLLETVGERTFEVRKFPVPLDGGQVGVGGYMRDISGRLAAERALRESEEALRALYDNAPVGIFTSTAQGRYLKVNNHLAAMYGYGSAETLLASVTDIQAQMYFDPDERDAFLDALGRQGHLVDYESRRLTRAGQVIWVSLNLRAVRDADGGIVRLDGFCTDVTKRKAAEAVLASRERQLRVIFDNSPLGLVFFDETGTVVNCNARILELLGLRQDQLIGHNLLDRLPPPIRDTLQRALAGQPASAEGPYTSRISGKSCHVRSMFNPVEAGRNPTPVIASVEDISAMREKDAALRLLWAAVEQSPASIVITDTKGIIEYVNPHFSILTGYMPEEAKGLTPRVLKSDVHPDAFYREMWETLAAGQIWRGELCNRKKNGELYWEDSSISPVRDDAGQVTHYVAVKEDITAQREREDRLRLLMREFEAIFNASSVGIAHLGPDEGLVRANRRFGELFGLAPESLAGRTLSDIHGDLARLEAVRRELLDRVAAGEAVHAEERLRTSSGRTFWCSIHGRRIDPDSPASGSLWVFDDVSARKELEGVREDVERIMRHDLKAPLNSIVNLPGLVMAVGEVNEEQREMLAEIERAGQAMLEQIELSLDLYKMETGTYVLAAQRLDLARIVSGVAEMLSPAARARGVAVGVAAAEPVFVLGNALLCQNIVANLLKNAIEAEPAGSAVTVSVTRQGDRGVLRLANPAPVPEDIVPVFFEKYATGGKQGGSGLGAYSARLMTLCQNGVIDMETEPGQGTRVTVALPIG